MSKSMWLILRKIIRKTKLKYKFKIKLNKINRRKVRAYSIKE